MQNNTFPTLFVGQNLIKLSEVDSTNNFLKNLASKSEPLPEGTVIMADNQFAGRGQQNSVWEAEPGKNLIISVYLQPTFLPIHKQFYLNMAISVGVGKALSVFLPETAQIKWPNDLFYNNKKIGGMLIENALTGNVIKSSVIGIGLNINQRHFSEEVGAKGISLIQILNESTDLQYVLEQVCIFIEKYYQLLRAGHYDLLQSYYLKHLYKYEIPTLFKKDGVVFEGTILKIEEGGRLVVKTLKGLFAFGFKEIEFIQNT